MEYEENSRRAYSIMSYLADINDILKNRNK